MMLINTCDIGVNIDKQISGKEKTLQKLIYTYMHNYLFTEPQRQFSEERNSDGKLEYPYAHQQMWVIAHQIQKLTQNES